MSYLDLGATDFTKSFSSGGEAVGWRLLAYLSWPQDEKKREQYLATLEAESASMLQAVPLPERVQKQYQEISVTDLETAWAESKKETYDWALQQVFAAPDKLKALTHAPGLDALIQETGKNTIGCLVAGHILYFVFIMDKFHKGDLNGGASVSKAVEVLEERSEGVLPKNRKDILKLWSEFKSVSHLGAALNILSPAFKGNMELLGQEVFNIYPGPFLTIAKELQQFGLTFKAHGQKQTILDPKSHWRIPDNFLLPPVKLNFSPLSGTTLQILQNYRAPVKL
jgi:hypothetical protein